MKRAAREIGFAFLAWLLPFVFSGCIIPLKTSHEQLFDSLMGVAVACSTVALAVVYFQKVTANDVAHGLRIGILWAVANWMLDGIMFSSGPMKMSLNDYVMDIGVAYLAIPAITLGLGIAAEATAKSHSAPNL